MRHDSLRQDDSDALRRKPSGIAQRLKNIFRFKLRVGSNN